MIQTMEDSISYLNLLCQLEQRTEYDVAHHDWLCNTGICKDTTATSSRSVSPPVVVEAIINMECRSLMIQWCYDIIDLLQMNHNTVEIAITYIDRFMCTVPKSSIYHTNRDTYQLVCLACIYCAVKIYEPIAIDSTTMVTTLCCNNDMYTTDQLEEMERLIYRTLQWKLNPPTTIVFAHEMLSIVLHEAQKHRFVGRTIPQAVQQQIEKFTATQINDYRILNPLYRTVKASTIAYCSVIYSIHCLLKLPPLRKTTFVQQISSALNGLLQINDRIYDPSTHSIDEYLFLYILNHNDPSRVIPSPCTTTSATPRVKASRQTIDYHPQMDCYHHHQLCQPQQHHIIHQQYNVIKDFEGYLESTLSWIGQPGNVCLDGRSTGTRRRKHQQTSPRQVVYTNPQQFSSSSYI